MIRPRPKLRPFAPQPLASNASSVTSKTLKFHSAPGRGNSRVPFDSVYLSVHLFLWTFQVPDAFTTLDSFLLVIRLSTPRPLNVPSASNLNTTDPGKAESLPEVPTQQPTSLLSRSGFLERTFSFKRAPPTSAASAKNLQEIRGSFMVGWCLLVPAFCPRKQATQSQAWFRPRRADRTRRRVASRPRSRPLSSARKDVRLRLRSTWSA